jgi:Protein of unknown function (DUF2384)
MPSLEHYLSVFFVLGLLVVMAHAWQRFNEPSFPNRQALPRTVDPLQYLFLRPAYGRARLAYVTALLLLYGVLVAAGQSIVPTLGAAGMKDFPPEAWALLIALILTGVGLAPEPLKWLNTIEEQLRRGVHAWFLVPGGVERIIGVLEDARYEPPASQLSLIANPAVREKLQDDLKLSTGGLRYRWARATMLMMSLRQMGAGMAHPLQKAAFEPFKEDFDAILVTYRALKQDVQADTERAADEEAEENLIGSVDNLLKRIYAYVSWGILRQVSSDREGYQTLEALGFRIPKTGGRRLFDIAAPAVFLVALITMVFWVAVDTLGWMMKVSGPTMSQSIVSALTSAMAASIMYGVAVFIALNGRHTQIERKVWREGSPRCLIPIAIKAGLVTWCVIIATTVLWDFPEAWQSFVSIIRMAVSVFSGDPAAAAAAASWSFLPARIGTALPWLLVGATASAVLANSLSGDVRRTDRSQRLRDAIILGIAVGLAAGAAQLIQLSLMELFEGQRSLYGAVPIVALAGFACGVVIGSMVPAACRTNLVTPLDPIMARSLRELQRQAQTALGKPAADDWLFSPNSDLGGITPAEAIQHKTHATGVGRLLESEAALRRDEAHPDRGERTNPVVIEGGRSAERPEASFAYGH